MLNKIVLMNNTMTNTDTFHNDSPTGAVTKNTHKVNSNYWTKIMQDTWFYEEIFKPRIKGRAILWRNNIKQLKELKKGKTQDTYIIAYLSSVAELEKEI